MSLNKFKSIGKTLNSCYLSYCHTSVQILFPLKLFTAPGGSRDGENFNLRHKSRDEILREMIDQGYNLKMT